MTKSRQETKITIKKDDILNNSHELLYLHKDILDNEEILDKVDYIEVEKASNAYLSRVIFKNNKETTLIKANEESTRINKETQFDKNSDAFGIKK